MLAELVPELPEGWLYEPKWDGFRCLVAREDDVVEMMSRHGRPFARYFPEIVEAVSTLPERDVTLDGEIVIETDHGYDFAALLSRLHPAGSRVERLRRETPARFVAFDTLWRTGRDLREVSFRERRRELEEILNAARRRSRRRTSPATWTPPSPGSDARTPPASTASSRRTRRER